jgi:hypothetical protein
MTPDNHDLRRDECAVEPDYDQRVLRREKRAFRFMLCVFLLLLAGLWIVLYYIETH